MTDFRLCVYVLLVFAKTVRKRLGVGVADKIGGLNRERHNCMQSLKSHRAGHPDLENNKQH